MDSVQQPRLIYFVGQHLGHAVTNQIHDMIADDLNLPWKLRAIDSSSLDEFLQCLRGDRFGGAVVTIPHKITIMPHLDRLDGMCSLLGACNNIYRSSDGALTGTNTDWIGVRDSLLQLAKQSNVSPTAAAGTGGIPEFGKSGFVVGSGGAARAAVYTLHEVFGASKIYVINRDAPEVEALSRDITRGYNTASLQYPEIVHLQRPEQVAAMDEVFYGVGTVPDFEPQTPAEIQAFDTYREVLERNKGVFLDMCYRPRFTRNLRLAKQKGWNSGDGGQVVAWQLKAQWELWAGREVSEAIPLDRMVENVHKIVEGLP